MRRKKNLLLWAFGFLGTLLIFPIDTIEDELEEKRAPEKVIITLILVIAIAIITNTIGHVIGNRPIDIVNIVVFQGVFIFVLAFFIALIYIISLSILKKEALFGDLFFIGVYSLYPLLLLNNLVSPLINHFSSSFALYPVILGFLLFLQLLMMSIDKFANVDEKHQRFKLHLCSLSLVIFVVIFINLEVMTFII